MKRVEYDIEKSDYCFKYHDLIFYFSSQFNRNRFAIGYEEFVNEETNKLKAKYHVDIELEDYLLVAFYKRIEKRGFKILSYDEEFKLIPLSDNFVVIKR